MASRDLEGSREIEAAKKRLAAAKARAAAARQMKDSAVSVKESAKAMVEEARKRMAAAKTHDETAAASLKLALAQVSTSDKEVVDAKKFLADAEKRWEVIDVDADEQGANDGGGGSKKKRKVSLSPGADGGNQNQDSNVSGTNTTAGLNNGNDVSAASTEPAQSSNDTIQAVYPDRLFTHPCPFQTREPGAVYRDWCFPMSLRRCFGKVDQLDDGVPIYVCKGRWAGALAPWSFVIYRREYRRAKYWFAGVAGGQVLLRTDTSWNEGLPDDRAIWTSNGVGTRAAPELSS